MDHPDAGKLHSPKMSELGVAVFDPRDPDAPPTELAKSHTSSNNLLESLAMTIKPEHIITNERRHITEDTCDAPHHRQKNKFPNKAHHAQPYRCRFVHSRFMSQAHTMERLKTITRGLSTQHQTEEEKRTAKLRSIKLIVWASYCEEQVFLGGGIDLYSLLLKPSYPLAFLSEWIRSTHSHPAKGETAFQSLGALGIGVPLHNGCNNAVSQLISFMRFLVMTPAEWHTWFNERGNLDPISLGWVKPAIYSDNYAQRPIPPPPTKKNWHAKKHQPTIATSSNWKQATKTPCTTNSAPRVITNPTSNGGIGQSTWGAEANSSRGNNSTWAKNLNKAFPDYSNKAWPDNANNGWSDKTSNGWPNDIASNDWANCSGSGWPNSSSPESNTSNDSSASISGWPAGMDGWSDSSDRSTGWPDGMIYVDNSEDPANSSGWPPRMDGWNDSPAKSTGWPDGKSDMDGAEDPSVNFSGWPAGMDDPEDKTSAVASGNTKNEKDRESVLSSSDGVLDSDEWFTVYHSRRGKKGPLKPNAYRH
ncbi:hypothetical protein N0V85_009394 [Neurospora sp. IMI 360204]|nr:hypothetical protein N0V85_009394 [Neurospora sp. IMI 360204]